MTPPLEGLPLDHIGIAVPELEAASQPYRLLGLRPHGDDELIAAQQVAVRSFQAGASLIELLAPTSEASPIAKFLAKRGAGLHHAAFRVPDIRQTLRQLAASGAELIDQEPRPGRAGSLVAFVHPRWAGGVLIELVEHPNRPPAKVH
jgi:methylmalonyl-CoA/ethylmalonyl-CoA epimerase